MLGFGDMGGARMGLGPWAILWYLQIWVHHNLYVALPYGRVRRTECNGARADCIACLVFNIQEGQSHRKNRS